MIFPSIRLHWEDLIIIFISLIILTPFGRPRSRWEDNIKMDLLEVGSGGKDWIELTQDRERWRALLNVVKNLRFP